MSDTELIIKYVPLKKQKKALKELKKGKPVQYIIGNVDFYNSNILVNKNVLIPRFETELFVEKILKRIEKYNIRKPEILEIGSGSGCITIAINKELNTNIDAIEISKKAIKVSKKNAKLNNVLINYILSDVKKYKTDKKYDLIISNPPYVADYEIVDIKTKYEPQNAIFAADNGLYFYKLILNQFKNNLNNKFLICFEIGEKQGKEIKKIAEEIYENVKIFVEKDYTNRDRYVFITNFE